MAKRPVTVMLEHDLGIETAKQRVDERFDALKESIGGGIGLKFERAWEGDQLQFTARGMGQTVTGEIDVFPQHVRIVVVLPGLLASMAEALQGKMEQSGRKMLENNSGA